MNEPRIELELPQEIYERARQIAEERNRSLESVLLDGLALLFGQLPDARVSADKLAQYTDEELWALVHQGLAWPQDARMRQLVAIGQQRDLSDMDQAELERLIDLADRHMLLRSQALLLLKQRGHDVEAHLKLGA